MDISVVIPCHNAAPTLTRLLESLDQQTLNKSQYEVLVIDDGSTDNSPQLAENFKDVRVIKQSCSGPGAARNRGAQEAKGRIILFLDSDLEAASDLLQQHLDAYKLFPDLAAAGGSVEPLGKATLFSWQLIDHLSSWFNAHPGCHYSKTPEYLPSLNFSINRTLVINENLIFWESSLGNTGEDVLYCHALQSKNLRLAFLPQARVRHLDRSTLKGYFKHMYRWGAHAPIIRGRIENLKYSFLFPKSRIKRAIFSPAIVFGYTWLIWKSWFASKPIEVTLSLPQIFLGRIFYCLGVLSS